jgi:hypothetical protein
MFLHHEKIATKHCTHISPSLRENPLIGWVPFYKHPIHEPFPRRKTPLLKRNQPKASETTKEDGHEKP